MQDNKRTIRAGIAALLTIIWAAVIMLVPPKYAFPHQFNHDVDSPILALEISHDAADIDLVLRRSSPDSARAIDFESQSNKLDLVFIPLYAFSLWSLARVFTDRTLFLTLLILGAAFFDYWEDWRIFQALKGENPAIYIPSLAKWGLLGVVLFATGVILLRSKSPVYSLASKRLLFLAYLLSSLLLLISVALGSWIGYSLIALGSAVFAALFVVHAIAFLGPYLAIPGIKPVFVENFCEERKKAGKESLVAVKAEPADGRGFPPPSAG